MLPIPLTLPWHDLLLSLDCRFSEDHLLPTKRMFLIDKQISARSKKDLMQ